MPHVTDGRFRAAYRRTRTRAGDSSPGVKAQATLHGIKFKIPAPAVGGGRRAGGGYLPASSLRLATRPVLHAESEPGAGNGELGRAPLADI